MRILCIGDPHIKWNSISRSTEMVEAVITLVEQEKPDLVVIMGDTLDRFEDVKTTPLTLAVDFIDRLSKLVEVYLLIGNHDYPNPSVFMDAPHPFTALRRWDNVTVVDKVINVNIEDYQLTFAPYVATGRFVEALDTAPGWRDSHLIFAHQEFKGCKMGAVISEDGDYWSPQWPQVISGHIHEYQILDNILYVGCPIQHSFGDRNPKTVSMVCLQDTGYQDTRISLKVKDMILLRTEATELPNLDIPMTERLKIIVTGTVAQNNAAKKLAMVKELRRLGHKIVFKDRRETTQPRLIIDNPKVIRYADMLYQSMEGKPALQQVFRSIFSN